MSDCIARILFKHVLKYLPDLIVHSQSSSQICRHLLTTRDSNSSDNDVNVDDVVSHFGDDDVGFSPSLSLLIVMPLIISSGSHSAKDSFVSQPYLQDRLFANIN